MLNLLFIGCFAAGRLVDGCFLFMLYIIYNRLVNACFSRLATGFPCLYRLIYNRSTQQAEIPR